MDQSPSTFSQLLPFLPLFAIFIVVGYFMLRWARRHSKYRPRQARPLPSTPLPHFVFAKITDPIMPMQRGPKYADPLDDSLQQHDYGFVTGGGTQMDKQNRIVWIGLDIELRDLDAALQFTRDRLRELGAPAGSVLEYRVGNEKKTLDIA